jgi:hypothetical protein
MTKICNCYYHAFPMFKICIVLSCAAIILYVLAINIVYMLKPNKHWTIISFFTDNLRLTHKTIFIYTNNLYYLNLSVFWSEGEVLFFISDDGMQENSFIFLNFFFYNPYK